ncbi:peptidoglycan-binding protein [Rhodanobacter sp. 7MK24]|uniref:peptidoglycan-binding domain-containing protein n=1 Tax=Rhodanobacter sp. 7MK24 TaxID=2775922 RepID=UPI00177E6F3A|nr:peptidoglycan-binding domain-containing protein [Rhodanobacter sp. 7MK24]MBD8881530.1 peptidoglycan-binding protein [Rhodanobacter sp. 7MK24]
MAQPEWHLGQTSAHYEGHGPGTISSGKGDYGGVSYGTYQFSTQPDGGSMKEFLHLSVYRDQFKGLEPVTPAFNAKWKELAQNDPGFARDQYDVMKATHYDALVARLKSEGIDLTGRGPAVQDALWSTSVQFGPNHWHGADGPDVFEKGLHEKFGKDYELSKLSDADVVEAVQDYKIKHNETLFTHSPKQWASLENRARNEKADLLKLAGEKIAAKESTAPQTLSRHTAHIHAAHGQALEQGAHGPAVTTLQADLSKLGYGQDRNQSLKVDGDFGPHTRQAVERFQHDHHLTMDGKAGPVTQQAMHSALRQHSMAHALSDPKNPDHALYEQALAGVRTLDAHGHPTDQQRLNLAASLAVEAKQQGMTRIDQVALGDNGSRVYIAQHPTSPMEMAKFGSVDTVAALQTPMAQSSAMAASAPPPSIAPQAPVIQPSAPAQAMVL